VRHRVRLVGDREQRQVVEVVAERDDPIDENEGIRQ